jgi:hypothetical protein
MHYKVTLKSSSQFLELSAGEKKKIYEVIPKIVRISALLVWHSKGQKSLQYLVHILGGTMTS